MTLILAFVLMLLIFGAMAIGVMMGRKPIAGSCGGAKALGLDGACACGRTPGTCSSDDSSLSRLPEARAEAAQLAVDAAQPPRPGTRML